MNFYNKYILPKFLSFEMKRKDMEKYRPSVASQAFGTVLEIGFGSGLNLPCYDYKNITKLYALDISLGLFDLAKESIEQVKFPVEFINASAEKIPLADGSVDSVVSTWSLCSIPHPSVALGEVFRVLKPGGKFIFIEHGKFPKGFMVNIQKFLSPLSEFFYGGCSLDRGIES